MKNIKKILILLLTVVLSIQLFSCTDNNQPVVNIAVDENISLTSNENVDWSEYITFTLDNTELPFGTASVTLISGTPTESGTCTYEVLFVYESIEFRKQFEVTYTYTPAPIKPDVVITIDNDINLTSNENINWSDYITFTLNATELPFGSASVTLVSGTPTVTGTCTYKVTFTYETFEYTKEFNVTYTYTPAPVKPDVVITIDNDINLTSNENINWSDYITFTLNATELPFGTASVTLVSGTPTVTGTCTYKVTFTYETFEYTKEFNVTYTYTPAPVKPDVVITIDNDINLTSNENINWSDYITFTLNDTELPFGTASVTLVSGTPTVTGTCTYKVTFTYETFEYTKEFNVTYTYTQNEGYRDLTTQELALVTAAIAKDYSNATIANDLSYTTVYFGDNYILCEYTDENGDDGKIYFRVNQAGTLETYDPSTDSWYETTDEEYLYFIIDIDFTKIDVTKIKYEISTEMYFIDAQYLNISEFCPFWDYEDTVYTDFTFTLDENGYINLFYCTYLFEEEKYYDYFRLEEFGTTEVDEPTADETEEPSEFTLGDIQGLAINNEVSCEGIVVGVNTKGLLLKDLNVDEYVYVYKNSQTTFAIGDVVNVSGTVAEFGLVKQIAKPTITASTKTGTASFEPTVYTGADLTAYASNVTVGVPVAITGTLKIEKNYYNVTVAGTSIILSICYPTADLSDLNGKESTFYGYLVYLSGSNKYANLILVDESEIAPLPDDLIAITDAQKTALEAAIAKDYSNATYSDGMLGSTFAYGDDFLAITQFSNGFTSYAIYKDDNGVLKYYDFKGWNNSAKTASDLISMNLASLELVLDKVLYNTDLNTFFIPASDLAISTFIPFYQDVTGAKFIILMLSDDNTINQVGVAKNTKDGYEINISSIYSVGTTDVANPEDAEDFTNGIYSPYRVDVVEIQDYVLDQYVVFDGIVVAHTTTGIVIADEFNRYSSVYVDLGVAPTYQIGTRVTVKGNSVGEGYLAEFEAENSTVTASVNTTASTYEFNPEFFVASNFENYFDSPYAGAEVEFIATLGSGNKLTIADLDSSVYTITALKPSMDISSLLNKTVLVKGYIITANGDDYSASCEIVISSIVESDGKNPHIKALTTEQVALFEKAKAADYSNVTYLETGYSTILKYVDNMIYATYDAEDGSEQSYVIKQEGDAYLVDEGSGFETLPAEEYALYILEFNHSLIDISKLTYNDLTDTYSIDTSNLDVSDYVPYWYDADFEFLSFEFNIDKETFSTIICYAEYQGYVYDFKCIIYDLGNTTAN